MRFTKLFLPVLALLLLGAGCIGTKSKGTNALDGGVFKSGNAGEIWNQMSALPTNTGVANIGGTDVVLLEMDPQDPNAIYAGTREDGLIFTQDGAQSWQQPREAALRQGRIHALAINPKDVCTVYVAKGSQLFKSIDCLRTFDKNVYTETRAEVFISFVEVDWFNPQIVWMALSNGDLLKSTDGARTWNAAFRVGAPITSLLIHQKDSRRVLIGTQKLGLVKTVDGGKTWKQIIKELNAYEGAKRTERLFQDAQSRRVFLVSKYGLLSSSDFGDTWNKVNTLTSPGQVHIPAAVTDPNNPNTIYYVAASTFYTSYDHGKTWTTKKLPSTRTPSSLLVDPRNGSVIYMGVQKLAE